MSKTAAIDVAVRMQLAADGRLVDYTRTFGAMTDPAGALRPYDGQSMRTFLLNVSNRLRLDEPAWHFTWATIPAADRLNATISELISEIGESTKPLNPAGECS